MNRRSFLSGILAAAVAPAIIRTPGLIMPVKANLVPSDVWGGLPTAGTAHGFYANRTIRCWMDIEAIRARNILLNTAFFEYPTRATFRDIEVKVSP